MKKVIFNKMCFLSFIAVFLVAITILGVNFYTVQKNIKQQTQQQAMAIAVGYDQVSDKEKFLTAISRQFFLNSDLRITLINGDGTVSFDNLAAITSLENHNNRPEILEARAMGAAAIVRFSATLQQHTFYYALRLSDGEILRVANTTSMVIAAVKNSVLLAIAVILLTLFLAALISSAMTKRIIQPLNGLNLDEPLANNIYEEFAPLLNKLNMQNQQIERQINLLRQKNQEFTAITENMNEGLVIVDASKKIISLNNSAKKLFSATDRDYEGENIVVLCRNVDFNQLVTTALEGTANNILHVCGNQQQQVLQLFANPVLNEEKIIGCVILVLDISYKYTAEKSRREFTANVSHELKTPLTSISGYGEIIALGLVKQEDVQAFGCKIQAESGRLLNLINDIIKLSQLDEGPGDQDFISLNLLSVCQKAAKNLQYLIDEAELNFEVSGVNAYLLGIPQIIDELVFNLCENAIKYNHAGGWVKVRVAKSDSQIILTVADSGVGIPLNEQEHIFERFYRIEKSRSKQVGGTGLGLSIVKHAALYHHAVVTVESTVGVGTCFQVSFPSK